MLLLYPNNSFVVAKAAEEPFCWPLNSELFISDRALVAAFRGLGPLPAQAGGWLGLRLLWSALSNTCRTNIRDCILGYKISCFAAVLGANMNMNDCPTDVGIKMFSKINRGCSGRRVCTHQAKHDDRCFFTCNASSLYRPSQLGLNFPLIALLGLNNTHNFNSSLPRGVLKKLAW